MVGVGTGLLCALCFYQPVVVQILGSEARLPALESWVLGPVPNIMVPWLLTSKMGIRVRMTLSRCWEELRS